MRGAAAARSRTAPDALNLHLHPKQWIAFETPATEVLYGGAAGGGKSFLMRVAAIVWATAIPQLQVYLFRRISDDLTKNHMEGRKGFRAMLSAWELAGWCHIIDDEIRFWNGSRIYLCHCKDEKHIYKYQGAEIDVLLIDELTHFTEAMYRFLRSRCRQTGLNPPPEFANKFPRILCGANPGNIGHLWVKNTFINGAPPLQIRFMPKSEGGMTRQFIPAILDDNPSLMTDDPDYEGKLEGMGSATLVAAMRYGDWDVVEGAFFDCWSNHKHVIAPFTIPREWLRFRSGDWGSASPASIGWWAVVQDDYRLGDGQLGDGGYSLASDEAGSPRRVGARPDRYGEIQSDDEDVALSNSGDAGKSNILRRGSLIRYREDYVASGPNKGLKLTAEQVADRILDREAKDPKLVYGVLDPSAFKEDGGPSIAERLNGKLIKAGKAPFRPADNARVTKVAGHGSGPMSGWDIVRARMIGSGTAENPEPMIFCFATCSDSIRTIPTLQHDAHQAEDLDTNAEDHAADEWRYACLSRPWIRTKLAPEPPKDGYRTPSEQIPDDSFKTM